MVGILDEIYKLFFPINWPLQPADWLLSPDEDYVADDVTPVDWPLSQAQDDIADDVTPVDWPLSPAENVIAADVTPASFCQNIMVAYCVLPKFEEKNLLKNC